MDKQSILIVEDDLDLAEMLGTFFHGEYEILIAGLGSDALRVTAERQVNLVLLDIRLPDIDGYDVFRQLRQQRGAQKTPVIFLTQKSQRNEKIYGLELGVVDYITKPFDIQELRLRVRNAISRTERQARVNAVTDLPDVEMTEERLSRALGSADPWAVLLVRVGGIDVLREGHGFLAADEVLRAVSLMVRNALREQGADEDFFGHLLPDGFVVVSTDPARLDVLRESVERRIRPSLQHFYPPSASDEERSTLRLHVYLAGSATDSFADLDALRRALIDSEPPAAS